MRKSILTLILITFLIVSYLKCQKSNEQIGNNGQDTSMEDILEPRPEKKVNQPPKAKTKSAPTAEATDSDSIEKTTTGTFLQLERGDYTHLHIKDENGKETSFQIWAAYEGAADLNVDNWEKVKGEKIKVTWKSSEEEVQERGETVKMKKLLGVEIL